jgi:hypothetical protein
MRPDFYVRIAPTKTDVRVMTLLFGQRAHARDESLSLYEVLELIVLCQVMFFYHFPPTQLSEILYYVGAAHWRNSTATRHARSTSQILHWKSLLMMSFSPAGILHRFLETAAQRRFSPSRRSYGVGS